jgi:hypothetical protein
VVLEANTDILEEQAVVIVIIIIIRIEARFAFIEVTSDVQMKTACFSEMSGSTYSTEDHDMNDCRENLKKYVGISVPVHV